MWISLTSSPISVPNIDSQRLDVSFNSWISIPLRAELKKLLTSTDRIGFPSMEVSQKTSPWREGAFLLHLCVKAPVWAAHNYWTRGEADSGEYCFFLWQRGTAHPGRGVRAASIDRAVQLPFTEVHACRAPGVTVVNECTPPLPPPPPPPAQFASLSLL